MTALKQPLHPNGGTPVAEADLPLSELQTVYEPESTANQAAGKSNIEQEPKPAIAQNGHEKEAS